MVPSVRHCMRCVGRQPRRFPKCKFTLPLHKVEYYLPGIDVDDATHSEIESQIPIPAFSIALIRREFGVLEVSAPRCPTKADSDSARYYSELHHQLSRLGTMDHGLPVVRHQGQGRLGLAPAPPRQQATIVTGDGETIASVRPCRTMLPISSPGQPVRGRSVLVAHGRIWSRSLVLTSHRLRRR